MRLFAIVTLALLSFGTTVRAESSDCKQCRDQQKACMSSYAGKTCKTEYDLCRKKCRRK